MGVLLLVIVHSMAAIAMWIHARRYGLESPRRWATAALLLGFGPFGPLAWITRDDWGIGNKLFGCAILFGIEAVVLAFGVGSLFG